MDDEQCAVGQYRTHDPPKNFRIRVTVRKVVDSGLMPTPQLDRSSQQEDSQHGLQMTQLDRGTGFQEELTIRWQEKFFSRNEFEFFGIRGNCLTSSEEKYHEEILKLRDKGNPPNKRIFTYLDADSFAFLDEIGAMTINPSEKPSYLVQKMAETKINHYRQRTKPTTGIRHRRENIIVDNPTDAMKQAHVLTTPSRSMQVMLDLNDPAGIYSLDNEHILCSVKLDANGQVAMKPDFNSAKPYRLEVDYGGKGIYEYTIEHCSDLPAKEVQRKEETLYRQLYSRHAEIMSSKIGNEFKPLMKENELCFYLFGEIVSACGFEYDNVYIQYFIDLPQGWSSDSSSLLGVTQRCRQRDSTAHFSFPFELQLTYSCPPAKSNDDPFIEWPTMYCEVCSIDSWMRVRTEGYGYCELPNSAGHCNIDVNTWRPTGDGLVPEMRRFFTGGGAELIDTTYVKIPAGAEGRALSKFYFRTTASGSIQLRFYTLLQYRNCDTTRSRKDVTRSDKLRPIGPADGLANVLDAFQRARKRLLEARAALPVLH